MKAFLGIGVFVQVGAVKLGQAVGVTREVGRHPVQDHAQTGVVRGVDKVAEVLRRAKARGGREQAQRLVAPGAVKRVLADGQQLQVGEARRIAMECRRRS